MRFAHRHTRFHAYTDAFPPPEKEKAHSKPETLRGVTADSKEKESRDG